MFPFSSTSASKLPVEGRSSEASEPLPSSRSFSTGAETDRRDLIAAACGVRTARDAAAAAASAAPGLGLGRTPRKSDGSGFEEEEEAPLLEKVLATREERVSDGEADVDLLGDEDADGERSGEGSAGGAGACTRAGARILVLAVGVDSSESESDEERSSRRSSTARRWSASASEAAEEVGEEGRNASRSSSCRGGGCCDAIADDDADGMGETAFSSKVFLRCTNSTSFADSVPVSTNWAEAHSIYPWQTGLMGLIVDVGLMGLIGL